MSGENDRLVRAVIVLAACLLAAIMVVIECMLLPRFGWIWIILLVMLVAAAGYAGWTIVRELLSRRG